MLTQCWYAFGPSSQVNNPFLLFCYIYRFSVFALGSTSYPKFCGFGKFLNEQLETLGGERLHTCGEGDEMGDQEADFDDWRQALYKVSDASRLSFTTPLLLACMPNMAYFDVHFIVSSMKIMMFYLMCYISFVVSHFWCRDCSNNQHQSNT